jgi:transposase
MQVVYPVCCGLDGHPTQLTACLRRVSAPGQITTELRECSTTSNELVAFREWLIEQDCPIVALESTGVSWRPMYHGLAEVVEVVLAKARDVRQRPGKKTDKADATWIVELLAHGLIEPSFIPPPELRALRDLTRTRVTLIQTRTQAKSRVHNVLDDTNVKEVHVVSDLFGKSGRLMLGALIAGERHPPTLAALALGK